MGFNPRARVGRDNLAVVVAALPLSFNPRARVGRDGADSAAAFARIEFQSTRPRGARPLYLPFVKNTLRVSIHAPAWGATRRPHDPCLSSVCFNPRARVGRDIQAILFASGKGSFNPRARVGRDGYAITQTFALDGFNPRARVGRDGHVRSTTWARRRFNPRARVGRDEKAARPLPFVSLFQSTRPRGARRDRAERSGDLMAVSIHAPAWGATP